MFWFIAELKGTFTDLFGAHPQSESSSGILVFRLNFVKIQMCKNASNLRIHFSLNSLTGFLITFRHQRRILKIYTNNAPFPHSSMCWHASYSSVLSNVCEGALFPLFS